MEHAHTIAARIMSGNDSGLLQTCISAWKEAMLLSQSELHREKFAALQQQAHDHIQDIRAEHARQVAAKIMSGNDSGLIHTCFCGWRDVIVQRKADEERAAFENHLQEQVQAELKDVRLDHAMQAAAKLVAFNDSGLVKVCFAGWREVVLVRRSELEKERLNALEG